MENELGVFFMNQGTALLEAAGGELADTPLSGDSYHVDTLESNIDTPSPSPGQGKKRRIESGSKYI